MLADRVVPTSDGHRASGVDRALDFHGCAGGGLVQDGGAGGGSGVLTPWVRSRARSRLVSREGRLEMLAVEAELYGGGVDPQGERASGPGPARTADHRLRGCH